MCERVCEGCVRGVWGFVGVCGVCKGCVRGCVRGV